MLCIGGELVVVFFFEGIEEWKRVECDFIIFFLGMNEVGKEFCVDVGINNFKRYVVFLCVCMVCVVWRRICWEFLRDFLVVWKGLGWCIGGERC